MNLFKNMSVGKKLYALALFFALALAGTIIFTVTTLSHQQEDSVILDIAGRQRMLVQKYTKELMNELNQKQVMHSALSLARTASQQIVADRAYYTKNVIGKLKREWPDFKGRVNYHEVEGAIPLPATFVKEVSAELSKKGDFSSRLVSKWPVNAELGLKSKFEKNAWDALAAKGSAGSYFEKRRSDQGVMIDYATKDAALGGCVSCHNGLSNSVKTNWITGELMGILVVSAPITRDSVLAENLLDPDHELAYSDSEVLFSLTLGALRHGGMTFTDLNMTDEIELLANKSPEIATTLTEIAALWEQLTEAARITEDEAINSPLFIKALENIHNLTNDVMVTMNYAITLMAEETQDEMQTMQNTEWIILILTLLIGGWFCFMVARGIVRPIQGAVTIADNIADGNLGTSADYDSKDEIGQMMVALERMRQALITSNKERDTRAKEERKAVEAQLRIQQKESDLVRDFEGRIAEVVESVDASAKDVGDMATQLSGQAEALMRQSQQAAAGASQGSQHVESTAAASEEISVTISDVSNRVDEALRISEQAVNQATATNKTLDSLSAASEEIDSVVRLIGDIAEQTNLLALNASIEAARAGDAGRGFAVVAGEVKDLANQTASATESISTQIANLQKESKAASSAIDEIGKIIHDVNKVNQDIAEAMNQQTQASREISEGAQMAASGMTTVSNEIAEVTQVADQTNAISGQLLDASSSLAKVIEQQQDIVGDFLEKMQGARSK